MCVLLLDMGSVDWETARVLASAGVSRCRGLEKRMTVPMSLWRDTF